jgi:hypothetical protein
MARHDLFSAAASEISGEKKTPRPCSFTPGELSKGRGKVASISYRLSSWSILAIKSALCERSVTSEQFSRSGGTEECQEVLNAVIGNRVVFHNRGSPPQDGGSFNKAGCQFFETREAANPMAKRVSPGCPAELEVRY